VELFSKTNEEMQLLHKAVLISFKKKKQYSVCHVDDQTVMDKCQTIYEKCSIFTGSEDIWSSGRD